MWPYAGITFTNGGRAPGGYTMNWPGEPVQLRNSGSQHHISIAAVLNTLMATPCPGMNIISAQTRVKAPPGNITCLARLQIITAATEGITWPRHHNRRAIHGLLRHVHALRHLDWGAALHGHRHRRHPCTHRTQPCGRKASTA